jgi:hypothetical protein
MGALAGTAITDIHIPYDADKLTTVPAYMFMNCEQLTNVTFDAAITGIGDYAFAGSGLTSFEVPAKVTKIGHYAFYQSNIQTLTFAEHASDIIVGDYAFADCDQLVSAVIPYRVSRFGNYVFAYCDNLTTFTFEERTTSNSTVIGTHFFYNCSSLTTFVLPKMIAMTSADMGANGIYSSSGGQNHIPSYMYAGTGITSAYIPSQIRYFESSGVFENCKQLTVVNIYAEDPGYSSINPTYFAGCDALNGNINWGVKTAA